MSFVAVAVAGAGVVGAVVAGNAAKDAAKKQANAVQGASDANIALERETRDRNTALFKSYMDDEAQAEAYADALYYGSGSYTPPGSNTPVTVSRNQVLAQIENTPLAQLADTDFAAREELTQDTYAGALDLADTEYGDLRGVADENYGAATGLASDARTGRRGVAQENLDSRLALEDESYAAWLPMSQEAENRAIDLTFSRGGVTGLVGQTREGIGRTTQDAAMERNLRRLEGYQAAYAPYYDDVTHAEDTYWGDMGAATDARGQAYTYATANKGDRAKSAYDAYSRNRAANYDSFAGDRLTSYGSYSDFLQDRQARGAGARENIAGYNSSYAASAAANKNRAADAAAAAYGRQGQINQQLYGDLAEIAGAFAGSITNKKK